MKTNIIVFLSALVFTACSKEEVPEVQTARVQFHIRISHPESLKLMPAYRVSGDIDGLSFSDSGEGNDFVTDAIEVEKGQTVRFNFNAESNLQGTYHVEVLVDGRIQASFGASCPSTSYQRIGEELPL